MASSFPILFGAPSFGSEDRDQWIRVLQLFLQDPFQPHAVNVGGETQIQYGWTVPAGAINGSSGGIINIDTGTTGLLPWSRLTNVPSFWQDNAFGIRELNPFSNYTSLSHGTVADISDRPGLLLVFGQTNNNFAMFMCGYQPGAPSTGNVQLLVSGDSADFSTLQGSADTFNCYFNGDTWLVENNFPYCNRFYLVFISMGQQVSQVGAAYSESFVGDGSTDTFYLNYNPVTSIYATLDGVPVVFEDGSLPGLGEAYLSPGLDALVFIDPPDVGADIQVNYTSTG